MQRRSGDGEAARRQSQGHDQSYIPIILTNGEMEAWGGEITQGQWLKQWLSPDWVPWAEDHSDDHLVFDT